MALPRTRLSRRFGMPTSSSPSKRTLPPAMRPPLACTRPTAACIVTLLPEPDSPTTHTTSLRPTAKDTSSTTVSGPCAEGKRTVRLRMSSNGFPRGFPDGSPRACPGTPRAASPDGSIDGVPNGVMAQSPARLMRPTESRMPSPIRLKHSTVTEMITPAAMVGTGDCAM